MKNHPINSIPVQKYEVTPLELFFDLVFVFAVSQLSLYLLNHLSWRGGAETLVMLLAIFGVWFTISWSATIIPADQSKTSRLILVVMVLGLFMNASVTTAFTISGWAFVIPLLLIQLGRAFWMLINSENTRGREHYLRTLFWVIATTPLWIIGAAVNVEARLIWWALAAGIDLIGRLLAHPIPGRRLRSENVPFDATHMLERSRLFLLIALGEIVLTIGMAISESPLTMITLVTGLFAFMGTIALWGLGFGHSHRLVNRYSEKTSDPILVSRHAANALMGMVAGLIAVAVANMGVIAHPYTDTSLEMSLLLCGGPIIFLIAQGWYLWAVVNVRSKLQLIGVIVLVFIGIITLFVPLYVALILVCTSLAILALFDQKGTGYESFSI